MSGKLAEKPVSHWGDAAKPYVNPANNPNVISENRYTILSKEESKTSLEVEQKPKLRELKPLHLRLQEYKEARQRIFGYVTDKVKKARERYKRR